MSYDCQIFSDLSQSGAKMTLPNFLLGMLISSLYGTIFHLVRGGGAGRLSLYLILAWVGFWAGHFIALKMQWIFIRIGPLNFGMATLSSLLILILGHWLSLVEIEKKKHP